MKIDMRIGNPAFLKPYWQSVVKNSISTYYPEYSLDTTVPPDYSMDYEKEGGKEELKEAIKKLHQVIGNAETEGYEVVIGNGATQLIFAALNVLDPKIVYAKKPYWFRFPEMIRMAGKTFSSNEIEAIMNVSSYNNVLTEIVTYPSNPENRTYVPLCSERKIFDCCYHWPTYHNVEKLSEDIMIFSLAKVTGHAGSRIGWALIKGNLLAKEMARYIEMTTGGVSVEAQLRAKDIIEYQLKEYEYHTPDTCFEYGRQVLNSRWAELLKHPNDLFTVSNGSGMFAWCGLKAEIPEGQTAASVLEVKTGILSLNGTTCGGDYNDLRLNMGCDEETWKHFMEAVKKLSVENKT